MNIFKRGIIASSGGEPTNIVAFYEFLNNVNDSTGNYNGTAVGSPSYGTDRNSVANQAIVLNGTSQYITIADDSFNSLDDFTIEIMVYFDGLTNVKRTIFAALKTNGADQIGVYQQDSDGKIVYYCRIGANTKYGYISNTVFSSASWKYLVWTKNGTTHRLYIDSVLDASTPFNETDKSKSFKDFTSPINYSFGVFRYGATKIDYWDNKIDFMRFRNIALTQSEITDIYNTL